MRIYLAIAAVLAIPPFAIDAMSWDMSREWPDLGIPLYDRPVYVTVQERSRAFVHGEQMLVPVP
jgi:hypothetical protein